MKYSKLIQLISKLSAWELRALKDFVSSPYFNKNERIIHFLDILCEAYPNFDEETISNDVIFRQLFPDEPFQSQRLYDLRSYLTQLVGQYFSISNFQRDHFSVGFHHLAELREKKIDKYYHQQQKRLKGKLSNLTSHEDYYQAFLLEEDHLQLLATQKKRQPKDEMNQMIKNLDISYIIRRLRYGCAMANRRDMLDTSYDFAWIQQIMRHIQLNGKELYEIQLIKIYIHIFQLITTGEAEPHFFVASQKLRDEHSKLPREGLRELYAYLMNYCIKQINQGETDWLPYLFDLYTWQLDKKILFEEGLLSPWDYKNIISLGLRMGKKEWTRDFIDNHKEHLALDYRDNAYTYNLAVWYHHVGEYHETLKLLRYIDFEDIFYELGAKTMLIKIYYETAEFDALTYLLDAFSAFLKRRKHVSSYQKELYENLIFFVKKLVKVRIKVNVSTRLVKVSTVYKLLQQIQQKRKVAQMDWLVGQVQKILSMYN